MNSTFLSGTEVLIQMLLAQRRLDSVQGIRSAGFVSGYRGSPLSGFDQELWRHKAALDDASIRFLPAVNEDLAATAVLGTQRIGTDPDALYEGVFALWYGKGPGVDRSGDALKHGNAYGASAKGGVLVVAGDDHNCVSSSMPHQSDQAFMAWSMPVLHPASVAEYIEFGLYGWALSRYSGTWVGFKAISETVESSASVSTAIPDPFSVPGDHHYPATGVHYRWPDLPSPAIEERLHAKLDAVAAFARANSIDKRIVPAPHGTIGIVTCGKAHFDAMEALQLLGLDEAALEASGVRLYKIGLTYPIELERLTAFVHGLKSVLIIEEKGPVLEQQIKHALFNREQLERPVIIGKSDEHGKPFIPATGQLGPSMLAPLIAGWLEQHLPGRQFASSLKALNKQHADRKAPAVRRTPYFCSGCPHNISTVVPEGSRAQAGIGCHFMAAWMDRKTTGLTQMGGEGADWVGQSLFTKTPHVFQNLGDGTYFHSGFLALRQAVAARTNITYKILYNDAVAMTGGQPIDGRLTVPQIARQVADEGVGTIAIVTDETERYAERSDLPTGATVHHRLELDAVQRKLRAIPGVTVLIYDQVCATEKRRRQKEERRKSPGSAPPARSVVINPEVCEGCGDCGVQSNCVSIQPLETEFGRKRTIDQSGCNKDFSCTEGYCPSFVTVVGGMRKNLAARAIDTDRLQALLQHAEPSRAQALDPAHSARSARSAFKHNIVIAGIGGTGIVTVGSVIAKAAHMEGYVVSTLNFKGFAQKGGAVLNHIRLIRDRSQMTQPRIDAEQADTVIVSDLVVGASDGALLTMRQGHTQVIGSGSEIATASFTRNPDAVIDKPSLLARIEHAAGSGRVELFDAQHLAMQAFGDAIFANMMLTGFAWQRGGIPVSVESISKAIDMHPAAEQNRKAFLLGRLIAVDESAARTLVGERTATVQVFRKTPLKDVMRKRADILTRYQNAAYADSYLQWVSRIEQAERRILDEGKSLRLTESVARNLFKLMAYKDEYEVARLFTDGQFDEYLRTQFDGEFTLQFHFAPPMLNLFRKHHSRKVRLGSWMAGALKLLAQFKFLRGTVLDPFGYSGERRMERRLISEYEDLLKAFEARLCKDNMELAIELSALPEKIRGFGAIKSRAADEAGRRREKLMQGFYDTFPEQGIA
ncbi:indolepyruvate ferredoxin oxidoreductase family protein [Noviherbaspirillum sp. CPCC 100848]|uniref:Indolepyruvate ferredoxin oxidoreductase family protein n=1 Tax=Noviherbaspirillum album TaxID=3080276 RepID=A0ABU6JBA1_9BURK|nr:indolepyruvate ferredoxin oxidoreductase family protein [Noviherbaspirillum sp. CPCC 100848]MEC4720708.1 indolepyruvate ferredoxin oxidoreductase family protein [Noviherbaspirillum sp. CPCC 100848]